MRISELSTTTGVPVATIKLYIREGLLTRGTATAPTQASYDQSHVARIRLIGALRSVQDLPLARLRDILAIVDDPPADVATATGRAVAALPPYPVVDDLSVAEAAIDALGLSWDPEFPATAQLQAALEALAAAGMAPDEGTLVRYCTALRGLAVAETSRLDELDPADAVAYAALGTALYEPLILALRRLLHQHLLTSDRR